MAKLKTILGGLTKLTSDLEKFCSKNFGVLEEKKIEVESLQEDQEKAEKVLKNVKTILGEG